MTGIEKAVEKAGGTHAALADQLGVTRQAVQLWVKQGYAPIDRIVEIEAQFGIDRKELIDPKLAELLERPFEGE